MKARDWAQQLIYKIIDPPVRGLIKIGVTPNGVTTMGLLLNIVACGILIYGGVFGVKGDFSYIGWAGFTILFAGLFDMLDGQVARIGKMSSQFGALYDSVLDRYSELIVFLGICAYFSFQSYRYYELVSFFGLTGSLMVSYVRARAEGLGIECKGGLMQRPERVVLTGVGALACGICYGFYKEAGWVLLVFIIPLVLVAVLANITAVSRLNHCRKVMTKNSKHD